MGVKGFTEAVENFTCYIQNHPKHFKYMSQRATKISSRVNMIIGELTMMGL